MECGERRGGRRRGGGGGGEGARRARPVCHVTMPEAEKGATSQHRRHHLPRQLQLPPQHSRTQAWSQRARARGAGREREEERRRSRSVVRTPCSGVWSPGLSCEQIMECE
eukprot:1845281-Rhodomonas_salina.1